MKLLEQIYLSPKRFKLSTGTNILQLFNKYKIALYLWAGFAREIFAEFISIIIIKFFSVFIISDRKKLFSL